MEKNFDIEERVEKAKSLFKEGYNCCQSVALAYSDLWDLDFNLTASLTSGFGGGVGRMREVCGCVSGMVFLCGMIHPAADPSIKADRTANYALVQDVAGQYKKINGSIICRELLTGVCEKNSTSPEPSDRTPEYYKKRPCEELVGIAAGIIGKKIKGI